MDFFTSQDLLEAKNKPSISSIGYYGSRFEFGEKAPTFAWPFFIYYSNNQSQEEIQDQILTPKSVNRSYNKKELAVVQAVVAWPSKDAIRRKSSW